MKRKAGEAKLDHGSGSRSRGSKSGNGGKKAKTSLSASDAEKRFRAGLFDKPVLAAYKRAYAESTPYRHAVIHNLVDDALLRSVRDEIRRNVHFTPKETDIYKIHQSGDLANLDGLDDGSLAKLPSLLALRDAIYSDSFRRYVSDITACGPLSGRKTDMAINVYTPGCYLLCHDDVIGSRRVSYILYLTDPDEPWKPEWGGALRLFPVQELEGQDGEVAKTPLPDVVKSIPPAWNQLSFFAVQPGQSFHDVEEVYHAESAAQLNKDGGRVRMAISGWFHIPQPGEDGYIKGEEERNAKNSSLMQLQGDPAQYDLPQPQTKIVSSPKASEAEFDEADLEFLLKYMAPTYLTPDTMEQISEHFEETSSITLANMLSKRFAKRLREYIEAHEKQPLPDTSVAIEEKTPWRVARPPHKHRYLYQQPSGPDRPLTSEEESPITELLDTLLPSRQFRHWLQLATGCTIESSDILARRFRRGLDYTLAIGHEGKPRLELNLGITPTSGWGDDEDDDEDDQSESTASLNSKAKSGKAKGKGKAKTAAEDAEPQHNGQNNDDDVGGHEVFMAGDDDDDSNQDAAVYKSSNSSSGGSSPDENILFFQAAAWNKLTIVLRDRDTLKFVKYVSRRAKGDRWDVSAIYEVEDDVDDDDDDDDEEENAAVDGDKKGEWDEEEEFHGFSD